MFFILEYFFITVGDFLIKSLLVIINFFLKLEDKINNSGVSDVSEVYEYPPKTDGVVISKFDKSDDFNLKNFKSLFFNSNLKKDLIFQNLEKESYKNDKKKSLISFFFNKSKRGIFLNNDSSLNNKFYSKLDKNHKNSFKPYLNNNFTLFKSLISKGKVWFIILVILTMILGFFISWEISLACLISIFMVFLIILYYPKIKTQNKRVYFSQELPYALRQLSTELKSGKSLFGGLKSIVEADYGVLSFEFSILLEEIKYGESTENAFAHLDDRIKSEALSRVINEILSSIRIGGNLAESLNILAEDINFDMRMKLKDYSERLNAFIMIYTFIAILAPVVFLTLILAASTIMGDFIPTDFILILYAVFFPMLILFLAFVIKKLEPKI